MSLNIPQTSYGLTGAPQSLPHSGVTATLQQVMQTAVSSAAQGYPGGIEAAMAVALRNGQVPHALVPTLLATLPPSPHTPDLVGDVPPSTTAATALPAPPLTEPPRQPEVPLTVSVGAAVSPIKRSSSPDGCSPMQRDAKRPRTDPPATSAAPTSHSQGNPHTVSPSSSTARDATRACSEGQDRQEQQ